MFKELMGLLWEAFCYYVEVGWGKVTGQFFDLFRSRRSKIIRELRSVCAICDHPRKAHTWLYGNLKGKVGDCGWVTKPGDGIFTDSQKICWCPKFSELSPLEICDRLEEKLKEKP